MSYCSATYVMQELTCSATSHAYPKSPIMDFIVIGVLDVAAVAQQLLGRMAKPSGCTIIRCVHHVANSMPKKRSVALTVRCRFLC